MGRKKRVSDQQILDALENMEQNETQESIAIKLGISAPALSKRMSKLRDRIVSHVDDVLGKKAIYLANDLINQSKSGKTEATKTAFSMLGKFRNKNEQVSSLDEIRSQVRQELKEELENEADEIIENL